MYCVPQTIVRTTDMTLWLYAGGQPGHHTIYLYDEDGIQQSIGADAFQKYYKPIVDEFGDVVVGTHDNVPDMGPNDILKPNLGEKFFPDESLKIYTLLTEEDRELRRQRALNRIVDIFFNTVNEYIDRFQRCGGKLDNPVVWRASQQSELRESIVPHFFAAVENKCDKIELLGSTLLCIGDYIFTWQNSNLLIHLRTSEADVVNAKLLFERLSKICQA